MSAPPLIDNVRPLDFVRPADAAELGDLIRKAAADGHGLFPVGGQTELHLGLPPNKPGIAVDMTGFDQVIDYPARDMTITVQAGITLAKLQALLATENQWLPIDVPGRRDARRRHCDQCQRPAPLRLRHAARLRHRHQLRERRGAGGQGRRPGGEERRRVRPVQAANRGPRHAWRRDAGDAEGETIARGSRTGRICNSNGCDDRPVALIHESKTRPVCVELLSGAEEYIDAGNMLVVGFEDNHEAIEWQIKTIQTELSTSPVAIHKSDQTEWDWSAKTDRLAKLSLKANLLPSTLTAFLDQLSKSPDWIWQAHAGNGIVNAYTEADWQLEQAAQALTDLRQAAVAAQGNLVITRCPPAWKRELPVWGEPRSDRA